MVWSTYISGEIGLGSSISSLKLWAFVLRSLCLMGIGDLVVVWYSLLIVSRYLQPLIGVKGVGEIACFLNVATFPVSELNCPESVALWLRDPLLIVE